MFFYLYNNCPFNRGTIFKWWLLKQMVIIGGGYLMVLVVLGYWNISSILKLGMIFFVSVQCCLRYIVARARSMFNVVS